MINNHYRNFVIDNHYKNFVEEIKAANIRKLESNRIETLIKVIGIVISVLIIVTALSMITVKIEITRTIVIIRNVHTNCIDVIRIYNTIITEIS